MMTVQPKLPAARLPQEQRGVIVTISSELSELSVTKRGVAVQIGFYTETFRCP